MAQKKLLPIIGIICTLFLPSSCEIELPPRYFEVNKTKNDLNLALIEDWGPGNDLRFRWWGVSFRSEEVAPENYITFQLGSFKNTGEYIAEGSYEYDFVGGAGFFTDIAIGYDISYDSKGYPIGNLLSDDFAEFSGYIDVSRDGGKYYFVFDIEVRYHDEIYTIVGEYEGRVSLVEGMIDLSSY